jgi:hypothetical protein
MRRRWYVVMGAAVLVLGAVALTIPLPSGSIRAVAEDFSPQGSTLTAESFEPRRIVCLGDNACPSVSRVWQVPSTVTTEEVQGWADDAGYDAEVSGDCATGACTLTGTADGWKVDVVVLAWHPDDPQVQVSLSVRR